MPVFTAETARKAAALSVASRQAAAQRPKPEPIPVYAGLPTTNPTEIDDFTSARLNRVRKQLDLVDSAIEREGSSDEPDGQRLNWLATAQERLAEQERVLAGRPLPGSRRPAPDGKRDRQAPRSFAPSAAEVTPAPHTEPKPLTP